MRKKVNKSQAYIFDLDGVITDTRVPHIKAWESTLNKFINAKRRTSQRASGEYHEFLQSDYRDFIDGRPRVEGIKNFLTSRGIEFNDVEVDNISSEKNQLYLKILKGSGVKIIRDTLIFIHNLKKENIPVGVVSSSMNAHKILDECGIKDFFDVVITPVEALKRSLRGKPSPDYFLEASRSLHVHPSHSSVIEDSVAGVKAAREGGFGEVIGMDHEGDLQNINALKSEGANIVVDSLLKLKISRTFKRLPNILKDLHKSIFLKDLKDYFLFLDFDGTISPIISDPSKAELLDGVFDLISELSHYLKICIITGRDTEFIQNKIMIKNLVYAASHGFDISFSHDFHYEPEVTKEFINELNDGEFYFNKLLGFIPGIVMERKKYGLALHYRMIKSTEMREKIIHEVKKYAAKRVVFKIHEGEMVIELLPNLNWDKGKAIIKIYEVMNLDKNQHPPLYIGDGKTDEDAFKEMRNWGVSILVSFEARPSMASFHLRGPEEVKAFLKEYLILIRGSHV